MLAGFRGLSPLVWAYLSLFTFVGFSGFFLPQYFIHQSLKDRKNKLIDSIGKEYEKYVKDLKGNWCKNYKDISIFKSIFFLSGVYSDIITSKTWVFDYATILKLIASAFIPIASLFIKEWILTLI